LALPFVIASQIRRNANLPVLILQTFLVFCCLGGLAGGTEAAPLALAFLCFLLLQAGYRGVRPPSVSRAALETVLVAVGLMAVCCFAGVAGQVPAAVWTPRQQTLLVAPFLLPALCFFRTRLILDWEARNTSNRDEMTAHDLAHDFARQQRKAKRRNRIESLALLGAALACGFACRQWALGAPFLAMAGIYGAAAAYLLLAGAARPLAVPKNFLSLRSFYQQELARQDQLRRFMWWLWLTPPLALIHVRYIGAGMAAGDLRLTVLGVSFAALLCFVIGAINRERGGRVQALIGQLSRMREKKPC
jgi:hypothetical protein